MRACGDACARCPFFGRECRGPALCNRLMLGSSACTRCGYLAPDNPAAWRLVSELGGVQFASAGPAPAWPELPSDIPVIAGRLSPEVEVPAVAVHPRRLFGARGQRVTRAARERGLYGAFALRPETRVVIEFFCPDELLEGFWRQRHRLYPWLAECGAALVIAPDFSVYEDAPRLEHLINMKRSQQVYRELLDLGLPAIPDVVAHRAEDLERWADWLRRHPPAGLALNFQCVKQPNNSAWKETLRHARFLHGELHPDIAFLFNGVGALGRAAEIGRTVRGREVHLMHGSAYQRARRRAFCDPGRMYCGEPWEEVFLSNVAYFELSYDQRLATARTRRRVSDFV